MLNKEKKNCINFLYSYCIFSFEDDNCEFNYLAHDDSGATETES